MLITGLGFDGELFSDGLDVNDGGVLERKGCKFCETGDLFSVVDS